MNKLKEKQIRDDFKKVLSSDAGLRVFGGIFYAARINDVQPMNEFFSGRRSMGQSIANTIRDIDPHIIAECELAYKEFQERNKDDDRRDDDGGDW